MAGKRRPTLRHWLIVALCLAVLIYFGSGFFLAYTDDAYVRSDFVPIAPEVDGIVQSIAVTDNQFVHAGDRLLQLDPASYRLALALKQDEVAVAAAGVEEKTAAAALVVAQIEAADAARLLAQQEYDRVKVLVAEQTSAQQQLDRATEILHDAQDRLAEARARAGVAVREVDLAKAAVESGRAALAIAAYALSRTEIRAPVDGTVTNLTLRPGVYARTGSPLIGLVDANRFRVVANFKQDVAASLAPGKTVWVWFDSHPGRLHSGRVESVARGISRDDAPGLLLPYVAPTTNWIRLSRRLPVTITFDAGSLPGGPFMGTDARVLVIQ